MNTFRLIMIITFCVLGTLAFLLENYPAAAFTGFVVVVAMLVSIWEEL